MRKGSITISVHNDITLEEIKEIRKQFRNDELSKDHKLNILVSGEEDMKVVLGNVLIEKIRNLKEY